MKIDKIFVKTNYLQDEYIKGVLYKKLNLVQYYNGPIHNDTRAGMNDADDVDLWDIRYELYLFFKKNPKAHFAIYSQCADIAHKIREILSTVKNMPFSKRLGEMRNCSII